MLKTIKQKVTQPKAAISIYRIYDDVIFSPKHIIDKKSIIEDKIKTIKEDPFQFANKRKEEDLLLRVPEMEIEEGPYQSLDDGTECLLQVVFRYTTQVHKPIPPRSGVSFLRRLSMFVGELIMLALIVGGLSFYYGVPELEKLYTVNQVKENCWYRMKDGIPEYIEIDDVKYYLNSDGSITEESKVFLNPYHEKYLLTHKCIMTNVETK